MEGTKSWFESWFNTPFYHTLYKHRDFKEAEQFITHLMAFLTVPSNSRILDLACGKGRHSIYLNKKGHTVTGLDISPSSIEEAQKRINSTLFFDVHDMREVYEREGFELILNLFTSFGYFESASDDKKVIQSVSSQLVEGGMFVLDYLNVNHVSTNLVKEETKVMDGITFYISRTIERGFIRKKIRFRVEEKNYDFEEKVKWLELVDFENYFLTSELKLIHTFGDYFLNPFDSEKSERLILICKKIT